MEYLNTHKQKTTCAQCGSNDFKSIDKSHIKCSHCGTQVDTTIKLTDDTSLNMEISDGAQVEVNAQVKIKGGLKIKGGTLIIKDGGSIEIG